MFKRLKNKRSVLFDKSKNKQIVNGRGADQNGEYDAYVSFTSTMNEFHKALTKPFKDESLYSLLWIDSENFRIYKGIPNTTDFNQNEAATLKKKNSWDELSKQLKDKILSNSENDTSAWTNTQACSCFVHLKKINNIKEFNPFLKWTNKKLSKNDYQIICVETILHRKKRLKRKISKYIFPFYYIFDYTIHRIMPNWVFTRKLYYRLTNGKYVAFSLVEAMGRLRAYGFSIIDYIDAGEFTIILSRKIDKPAIGCESKVYGLICPFDRVVKGGDIKGVYKIRTMYPYSEYLHDYVFNKLGSINGDKIDNDYRVTCWGRHLRKYWIDELPMLYHLFKGELKLVGVRPLSFSKFKRFTIEHQEKRTKTRPGLIPPYYADLPKTFSEFIKTEDQYLDQYFEHPLRTDLRYFFKAFYNIFFKGARSE